MSRLTLKVLALAAGLSLAGAAEAATVYKTILSGANEVPPNASPGTGSAILTIDGDSMRLQVVFADLVGTTTASHIHCCTLPGANAGVATTTPTFPGFPGGVTSGSYDQTFDMTLASSYNPAFVTANGGVVDNARIALFTGLADGEAYLNIHSSAFPGGEIRGQWTAVPEPQTWALMIVGFGLAGAAIRRRRTLIAA